MKQLFSSQQCLNADDGHYLWFELCMPQVSEIIESIAETISGFNRNHHDDPIKHVYIATDLDDHSVWMQISANITQVTFITTAGSIFVNGIKTESQLPPSHLTTDLYLLSYANEFIGNCVSSFSAFVSRYRVHKLHFTKSTHFWSIDQKRKQWEQTAKDEL